MPSNLAASGFWQDMKWIRSGPARSDVVDIRKESGSASGTQPKSRLKIPLEAENNLER